jgi:hypothetical protein
MTGGVIVTAAYQQQGFISEWSEPVEASPRPAASAADPAVYQRRALLIWPGLDRTRLRRTHGDPWKIAGLVADRTALSIEAILTLLMGIDAAAGRSGA